MNQVGLPQSWASRTTDTVSNKESFVSIGQHREAQRSGHSYALHSGLIQKGEELSSPQIQAEQKTEQVRKEWSASAIWESFTTAIERVVSSLVSIAENLWKGINQIKLAVSDLFKNQEVKSTQTLLQDEGLQHSITADGTLKFKEKETNKEKEFSMPHQMNRDLKGCRYYLGNEDLAEKAFQDLKNKGMKKEGDIPEGLHPGADPTVRLNAGLMLEQQFGHQGMLNIASLLTQAATPDLQKHIDEMGTEYHGREAGSKNASQSSFPEFHIQDQGDHVKLSMIIYLAVYPKDNDGFLDPNEDPSYVVGKREITISKEDLQQDWTKKQQWEIAPSLKANDSYSSLHETLNDAKKQMGLIKTQS